MPVQPLNCDPKLGTSERCPHCNLFHLRPGYCWKLDPIFPPGHKLGDELPEVIDPVSHVNKPEVTNKVTNKKRDQSAYMKEYMAKRRKKK